MSNDVTFKNASASICALDACCNGDELTEETPAGVDGKPLDETESPHNESYAGFFVQSIYAANFALFPLSAESALKNHIMKYHSKS